VVLFFNQNLKENIHDPVVIQVFSFSKTFAMAGFRLGYALADRKIIKKIIKFNQITITCVPSFIQKAGLVALREEKDFRKKMKLIYKKRLLIAQRILAETGVILPNCPLVTVRNFAVNF
jgi:aspartate aminotransferase